jgi:hypothetical protein
VWAQLVAEMGARKWAHIAQQLPRRNGKQCRERWHNHLDPSIRREEWTAEEVRPADGHTPNLRDLRVALGTGYHRVEGNRRASRNGRVSDLPPGIPN